MAPYLIAAYPKKDPETAYLQGLVGSGKSRKTARLGAGFSSASCNNRSITLRTVALYAPHARRRLISAITGSISVRCRPYSVRPPAAARPLPECAGLTSDWPTLPLARWTNGQLSPEPAGRFTLMTYEEASEIDAVNLQNRHSIFP